MRTWSVQDAKARFSEMLDTCLAEGPQHVSRRGEEQAVLVPLQEWRELQSRPNLTFKDMLLTDFARGDIPIPPRTKVKPRKPPKL